MNRIEQTVSVDGLRSVSGEQISGMPTGGRDNILSGVVQTVHRGLTRIGMRVLTGEMTRLRVRWTDGPIGEASALIGTRVSVRIPSEAVSIEIGLFRQGRRRWNRWVGRVVLVQREDDVVIVSVKLHGDEVVLRSMLPIDSPAAMVLTWDAVNVVVDPARISLVKGRHGQSPDPPATLRRAWHSDCDARVWLRARLTEIRQTSEGLLMSLDLGGASICAQISPSNRPCIEWVPGERVDVQVGVWEAWIRRSCDPTAPVSCRLLHLDHDERRVLS